MSRIFMYVVVADGGFAPNPFHGWCTLACCKPAIRRKAQAGDWIVGITPRARGNNLAYAMKVEKALTFEEYWTDKRFRQKRPAWRSSRPRVERCGDNCYKPIGDGQFRQLRRSGHWNHDENREDEHAKAKDLSGEHVLVSPVFSYFGENAEPFPPELSSLRFPARGHRVNFSETETVTLLRYLERLPRGVHGRPRRWRKDDSSWRQGRPGCA